eukprot:4882545-Amphidinium_carterae.1
MSSTLTHRSHGKRYCSSVEYIALIDQPYEEIPFNITAVIGTEVLETNSLLAVRITPNRAPIAGVARAVRTNGIDNYASLGSWGIAQSFSFSLWVYPYSTTLESIILSRHLSDGTNVFYVGFIGEGYFFGLWCLTKCWSGGQQRPRIGWVSTLRLDEELGLSADEIRERRTKPHHLAVTMECLHPGSETIDTHGRLRMYIDGFLVSVSAVEVCGDVFSHPLSFGEVDYVPLRPAPWELGSEYDRGPLDEHQQNVAVQPSDFFNGVCDELIFWNTTLTVDEVSLSSNGGIPNPAAIVVHYTFDWDDAESCKQRQLVNPTLQCHGLNEEGMKAVPQHPFLWSNTL